MASTITVPAIIPLDTDQIPIQHEIYINETEGIDSSDTTGTKDDPFMTLLAAYIAFPPSPSTPSARFYISTPTTTSESQPAQWREATKTALKKTTGRYAEHVKKVHRAEEEEAKRQLALIEARKVIISEDASLPAAIKMKISAQTPENIVLGTKTVKGTRVKVMGRIENIRASKMNTFVYLSDTRGTLLCIFSGAVNVVAPVLFQKQAVLEVYGEMKEVPAENKAPGDRELHVDYYKIIGSAPGGKESFTTLVPSDAPQATLPHLRHLVLRRPDETMVMKVRAAALGAFRQFYKEREMRETTAPSFVQTQAEGSGSLFSLPYYNQTAHLTQTSQLYLETQLPILGSCYAIQSSFRAENSHTRRHLSEYAHVEGELDFISFPDLLSHIEDLVCGVIATLLSDPESASYIQTLHPGFTAPVRPFRRMKYADAIAWLRERDVRTEEGKEHSFGDDIAEKAEREMTDAIGVPILLTHFPAQLKAFYMKRDPEDRRVTEGVDLLVPGVGEIVGGGMRMEDHGELVGSMREEGLEIERYRFYSDQRLYGSSPHGGYGLGLERFLAWILDRHSVRECVPYPRYPGKCTP